MRIRKPIKITFSLVICVLAMVSVALSQTGTPPEILEITFPTTVQANGEECKGRILFKDTDGDAIRADLEITEATDPQLITINGQIPEGNLVSLEIKSPPEKQKEGKGIILLKIATITPQQVKIRVVLADEAGNESEPGEFSFRARGNLPDLMVSLGTLPPDVHVGQEIDVGYTVQNIGGGNAGPFRVGVYLSSDPDVTAEDLLLGSQEISGLASDVSASQAVKVKLTQELLSQGSLETGPLFLGVITDDLNQIAESDETNNAVSSAMNVTPPADVGTSEQETSEPLQPDPLGLSIVPSDRVSAHIETDKDTYEVGKPISISFTITSSQPKAYAYVFDIDPDGTVALIFPNRFSQDPEVETNVTRLYSFYVAPPLGTEFIQLVASLGPLDLEALGIRGFSSSFVQIGSSPEEAAQKVKAASQMIAEEDIATAFTSFEIIESSVAEAEIRVDKGCGSTYRIGESITVSYMVTVDAVVTVTDILSTGSSQVLIQDSEVQGGMWYSFSGKVTPPTGTETLRLKALTDKGEEIVEECEFIIVK